jgi:hypothetical protein
VQPDVLEYLKRVATLRKANLPSSERIVFETFQRLGITSDSVTANQARASFDDYLEQVFREALVTLEAYEEPVYAQMAIAELTKLRDADAAAAYREFRSKGADQAAFTAAIQELFGKWYFHLRQLFLSVSQSRKTRGGRDFELQLGLLLRLAGFPYEAQHKQHRVDFMLPSYAHYATDRTQCVLLSAKRTLRERWQQVVDELHKMNCPNVYLATTDSVISVSKMQEIAQRNIKLVLFDPVKAKLFPTEPMVVDYTYLANSVLPQWEAFWPK